MDIALLQEPYTRYDRLVGLEADPNRILLSKGERRPGAHSPVYGAAIVVFNPGIRVQARHDLTSPNFAVITIELEQDIYVISAYF